MCWPKENRNRSQGTIFMGERASSLPSIQRYSLDFSCSIYEDSITDSHFWSGMFQEGDVIKKEREVFDYQARIPPAIPCALESVLWLTRWDKWAKMALEIWPISDTSASKTFAGFEILSRSANSEKKVCCFAFFTRTYLFCRKKMMFWRVEWLLTWRVIEFFLFLSGSLLKLAPRPVSWFQFDFFFPFRLAMTFFPWLTKLFQSPSQ